MSRDDNGGLGRKSQVTHITKKYFFLFEGAVTEPKYFKLLKKHRNDVEIRLKSEIEIIPTRKFGPEFNETDLLEMIEMANQYRLYFKNKRCDLYYFVSVVLEPIRWTYYNSKVDQDGDEFKINNERNEIVTEMMRNKCCGAGYITEKNFNTSLELCKKIILKKHPSFDTNNWDEFFKDSKQCLSPSLFPSYDDNDDFYVIRDRDFHEVTFTDKKYKDALELANKLNIQLAITTPLFEYWLLLHHIDDDFGDRLNKYSKNLVQNRLDVIEKRCERKDFDENWDRIKILTKEEKEELRKKQKYIDEDRFGPYKKGFRKAIERSKIRTHDNCELQDAGGTSLGVLFSKIIM